MMSPERQRTADGADKLFDRPGGTPSVLADRYRIERELARGGMARVFLAEDSRHHRRVAVKILDADWSAAVTRERFLAEIAIAARLSHPHIVPLFDSGEVGDCLYYVMPLVTGESLRDRLQRERSLPEHEAVRFAIEICGALSYAHGMHIVHRDIKPENILIESGHALVCDFGIARALETAGGDRLTSPGLAIGTPAYMSPEQALGEATDYRSDIYSLGCVLHEMLTGKPPFRGLDHQALVRQHLAGAPPALTGVSPRLAPILGAALATRPDDRPASTSDLCAALEQVQRTPRIGVALADAVRATFTPRRGVLGAIAIAALVGTAVVATPALRGHRSRTVPMDAADVSVLPPATSPEARAAYVAGITAVGQWDLATADSAFFAATRGDAAPAQAWLWVAQVRSWRNDPLTRWTFAIERAASDTGTLTPRDRTRVRALLHFAHGEMPAACALWSKLATNDRFDFDAWYSLGGCLRNDNAVVRDAASPSGWAFRTSYAAALRAYERAFALRPAIHRSFHGGSFDDVRQLLMTNRNQLHAGNAVAPDTGLFVAYPVWSGGDSLAFYPVPESQVGAGQPWLLADAVDEAITHERQLFYRIASGWRAAFPESAEAAEAVGVALDLLGNPSALDTIREARREATSAPARTRMLALEVWMRVKYGAPENVASLVDARRLADVVLRDQAASAITDPKLATTLASLAALTGQAMRAADYNASGDFSGSPPAVVETAPRLLAFASLGGPADSLRALEQRVAGAGALLTPRERDAVQLGWLVRSAALALPEYRFGVIPDARLPGHLAALLRALAAHDSAEVHGILSAVRERRRARRVRAADITPDVLYPEAAALAAIGDSSGALAWLAPTLDSLAQVPPQTVMDGASAGALVRAMALRAQLALATGDRESAVRWATAVATLWRDADPHLAPALARMRAIGARDLSAWERFVRWIGVDR